MVFGDIVDAHFDFCFTIVQHQISMIDLNIAPYQITTSLAFSFLLFLKDEILITTSLSILYQARPPPILD